MKPEHSWKCLGCIGEPRFEHKDFVRHVSDEHGLSLYTSPGGHELVYNKVHGKYVVRVWDIDLGHIKCKRKVVQLKSHIDIGKASRLKRQPIDQYMPFGYFKGQRFDQVPAGYLHFVYTTFDRKRENEQLFKYIERSIKALEIEHPDGIWEMKPKKERKNGKNKNNVPVQELEN